MMTQDGGILCSSLGPFPGVLGGLFNSGVNFSGGKAEALESLRINFQQKKIFFSPVLMLKQSKIRGPVKISCTLVSLYPIIMSEQ